eukprot:CAMPEP_0178915568 /NCGR_PEP_ID=MMETSP0786-20121207/12097_1 /TAXON_ID=186022 /ORGANISM="Thalassionema frauenfeldii, Strain CCMP 1798" /LENGTH=481 /DNA_ID=CAMNT_0020588689 /DNA_START=185 /DNA_END=1630 /DNA_ORIENTATION=-
MKKIGVLVVAASTTTSAFQTTKSPLATTSRARTTSRIQQPPFKAVTIEQAEQLSSQKEEEESPFQVDMTGVKFSGMNGKALTWKDEDYPSATELRSVIPKDCFEPDTATSLKYLSVSVVGTAVCTWIGFNVLLPLLPPTELLSNPLLAVFGTAVWSTYAAVTGTVAMGLWVLAHECGHGAFSKNVALQDTIGYILHSFFLVPYFSWQRSHAVHHKFTNHMDLGETHVPEPSDGSKQDGSLGLRQFYQSVGGEKTGLRAYGALQLFLHLVIGWPAYLWIGATGGPDRGMTNHYYPNPLTEPKFAKDELFPNKWKEKVWQSDIGCVAMGVAVLGFALSQGFATMMALYGLPLIVVNSWLVIYTWLQHTDVDVPHFSREEHNFVKGALHTIDRPYNTLDPWGAIDFLHHQIGTTHVAHHFASNIPHYKAQAATDAIQENFPDMYLYDPTPIPQALWRICKGCVAVEKRGDRWVWQNEDIPKQLL